MDGVVHIELTGRSNEVFDAGNFLEGFIVIDDDFACLAWLIGRAPNTDPDFGAIHVVFKVDSAPIISSLPTFVNFGGVVFCDDTDGALKFFI